MITRSDIAAHLEKNIRTGFLMGQKEYTPLRSAFVREVMSDSAFETYADMGPTPWPTQNSGTAGPGGTDARTRKPKVNRIDSGGQVTVWGGGEVGLMVNNLDYEIVLAVTHNAIDDDKAGDLETWARSAARTFEKHKDWLAFDALENGEATTKYGACYDGFAFFYDSHVDPAAFYTTAQDNKYASTLGLDNFETVKIAASKVLDGNGKPCGMNHSLLIVPPDLQRTAYNITGNPEAYDTANREINPYANNIRPLVAPGGYLGTAAWYLVDTSDLIKPLILQVRKQPELTVWDDNNAGDGGRRYYKFHARYAIAYGSWRHCFQGNT